MHLSADDGMIPLIILSHGVELRAPYILLHAYTLDAFFFCFRFSLIVPLS